MANSGDEYLGRSKASIVAYDFYDRAQHHVVPFEAWKSATSASIKNLIIFYYKRRRVVNILLIELKFHRTFMFIISLLRNLKFNLNCFLLYWAGNNL